MLVTTDDIAKATGLSRQALLNRLKKSCEGVDCAKIGGKWLVSSAVFPPVLRTVIEGIATARKDFERKVKEQRIAKRRMYHWLYRHPGSTPDDWRAITHADGKIKGSERVSELLNLARVGRKAKAAQHRAGKEVKDATMRKPALAVILANAQEKCDTGPSCSSGDVRPPASRDAGNQEGT